MKTKVKAFYVKGKTENQCYLLYQNEEGILVDPAWNFNLINNFLIENRITLKAILLTHAHHDHVHLAKQFSVLHNVPIMISQEEVLHYNYNETNLVEVHHLEEIKINAIRVLPIVTPGHTLGSTCYLISGNLFTGDTVFIEGVGNCNYENAEKLYYSIQFLKSYLPKDTLIWPGHSYGEKPGKDLNYLLKNNIYFLFEKKQNFIDFRTRKLKKLNV